jgi:hypothetical protein
VAAAAAAPSPRLLLDVVIQFIESMRAAPRFRPNDFNATRKTMGEITWYIRGLGQWEGKGILCLLLLALM